jgi:hypothetical protein
MTKEFLFSTKNVRGVFVGTVCKLMKEGEDSEALLSQSCEKGHPFSTLFSQMAFKLFNLFAKNICADIASTVHQGRKRSAPDSKTSRKTKKLQSTSN